MKNRIKVISVFSLMMVGMIVFSACSLLLPKSASAVMERYMKKVDGVENYHFEGNLDMKITMSMDDMGEMLGSGTTSIDMPVEVSFDGDTGKESSHMDMDMKLSLLGMSNETNAEIYADLKDGVAYTKVKGEDDWTKQDMTSSVTSAFIDTDALKDTDWSKFNFEKKDKKYVLTAEAKDIDSKVFAKSLTASLGEDSVSNFELGDEGQVIYIFDNKCNLVSSEIKDLTMTGSFEDTKSTVVINGTCSFSEFGEVDPDDYEIPSKVKKNAIDAGSDSLFTDLEDNASTDMSLMAGDDTEKEKPAEAKGKVLKGSFDKYYTVGNDIAPGTYRVYNVGESGICSIIDGETFAEKYDISMGYGLDDDTPDGFEVKLSKGDNIYITEDLAVDFRN